MQTCSISNGGQSKPEVHRPFGRHEVSMFHLSSGSPFSPDLKTIARIAADPQTPSTAANASAMSRYPSVSAWMSGPSGGGSHIQVRVHVL
jgi:hypothetical protein